MISVRVESRNFTKCHFYVKNLVRVFRYILKYLGRKGTFTVGFFLIGSRRMDQLAERLSSPKKRVVCLAFPDMDSPCRFPSVAKGVFLGEIYFCPYYLKKKSWSKEVFQGEALKAIIHSFLHLLGYRHEKMKARLEMEKLEEKLFKLLLPLSSKLIDNSFL